MLNKLHGTIEKKSFKKIAISFLVAFVVVGYTLPQFTAFAESEGAGEFAVTAENAETALDKEAYEASQAKQEEPKQEEPKQEEPKQEEKEQNEAATKDAGTYKATIDGYKVKVKTDGKAFEEAVELQIKEVIRPDEKVKDAANDKADVQKMSKEVVDVLKESNLYGNNGNAVDITFVNEEGKEVEPKTEVEVELTVDKKVMKEDIDEMFLRIDHVVENKNGQPKKVENLVLGNSENKAKNTAVYNDKGDKMIAKFKTDSFSVYMINGDPLVVNFGVAVMKKDGEGNEYIGGFDDSLTDQMKEWKNREGYGFIRFVDDSNKQAYYTTPSGDVDVEVDKTRYEWKVAYLAPRGTKEFKDSELIEISEIKYQNGKWIYWDRKANKYADLPTDRSYEIYSFYTDKQASAIAKEEIATVDSISKGLHMYMIDFNGGHDGDRGDSAGMFHINREYRINPTGQTRQGLYSNTTASNGYPTIINDNMRLTGSGEALSAAQKNLGYWLNNNLGSSYTNPLGSAALKEANHLFRLSNYDRDGYFFYDSALNAAYFDKNSGDFKVYDFLTSAGDGNYYQNFFYKRGMFMPYNKPATWTKPYTNQYDADGKKWADYTDADYAAMYEGAEYKANAGKDIYGIEGGKVNGQNYHFGMYMYCDFFQPINGQVSHKGYDPEDMVYEFTGDDDMLVYIDGVLVLDLGGIHDAQSGKINFATGVVDYTMNNSQNGPAVVHKQTTIKDMFEAANRAGGTEWKGNTFEAGTSHRIQIFYMERGAAASNLKIKLNIPPVPDGAVALTKAVEKLDGQVALNDTEDSSKPVEHFLMHVQIQKPGSTTWEDIPAGTEYSVAGRNWTVRKDGYLLLLDRETAVFNFSGEEYTKVINGQQVKTKIRVKEVSSSKLSREDIDNENFSVIEANSNFDAEKIYDVKYTETKAKSGEVIQDSDTTEVTDMEENGVSIDPAKLNMLTVHNKPASLKLKKEIENAINGDTNKDFTFNITVKDITLAELKFQAMKTKADGTKENTWITLTKSGNEYKATVTLKKDETIEIFNLPKTASYTVKEDQVAGFIAEYDNGGTDKVVSNSGVSGDFDKNDQAQDVSVTVNNRRPAALKIDSSDNRAIAGGKFDVYELIHVDTKYYLGECYGSNIEADSDGKIVLPIDRIPQGANVFIFEKEAPQGYERAKAPWIIWISERGIPTLFTHNTPYGPTGASSTWDGSVGKETTGEHRGKKYWSTGDFTKENGTAKLKNKRLPMQLNKVDGTNNTTPLAGAQFEMFKMIKANPYTHVTKGESLGLTTVSDKDGKFSLPVTDDGDYLMFEVKAPAGYVPSQVPWWVTIYQGEVKLYEYKGSPSDAPNWHVATYGDLTSFDCDPVVGKKTKNYPYETLLKVNEFAAGNGKLTLPGAKFDLYMAKDGSTYYSVDPEYNDGKKLNTAPIVSGTDGKVALPIPEPGKKYLLFETESPSGYERATAPWVIQANADGTIEVWSSSEQDRVVGLGDTEMDSDESVVTVNRWWKKTWYTEVTGSKNNKGLVNKAVPIELTKVSAEAGFGLPGAKFMVCKIDNSGTDYFVAKTRGQGDRVTGPITVADRAIAGIDQDNPQNKFVTSDENGKIWLSGLPAGKYFLFETEAPDGYQRATSPWLITITETNGIRTQNVKAVDPNYYGKVMRADSRIETFDGENIFNAWWGKNGSKGNWFDNQPITTELENNPIYVLPKSGGPGTTLFAVFGVLIMAAAAFLLFRRRENI